MNKVVSRLLIFFIGIPVIIGLVCIKAYNHLALHLALCLASGIAADELYTIFAAKMKIPPQPLIICCSVFIPFVAALQAILPAFGFTEILEHEVITYALIVSFMVI